MTGDVCLDIGPIQLVAMQGSNCPCFELMIQVFFSLPSSLACRS